MRLYVLVLATLAFYQASAAQTAPHLNWTVTNSGAGRATGSSVPMPKYAVVRRGTIVTVSGKLQDLARGIDAIDGNVYLKSGYAIRSRGTFHGDWKLEWNTADETSNYTKLVVSYMTKPGEPMEDVATANINLVDADPLTISATPNADGSAVIKLSVAPGYVPDNLHLHVDGNTVADLDAKSDNTISAALLGSPQSQAALQAVGQITKDGQNLGIVSTPTVSVPAAHKLHIDASQISLTAPDDPFESKIHIGFKSDAPVKAESVRCVIAGTPVSATPDGENGINISPAGVPVESDAGLYLMAHDTSGNPVFSELRTLGDTKMVALRQEVEQKWRAERQLLSRWKQPLTKMAALFPLRGDHYIYNFNVFYPQEVTYQTGVSRAIQGTGCAVAYRQVIPLFIDASSPGATQQIVTLFPQYWSAKDPSLGYITLDSYRSQLDTFFHKIDEAKRMGFSTTWKELYLSVPPHQQKVMDAFEKSVFRTLDLVAEAEGFRAAAATGRDSEGQLTTQQRYQYIDAFTKKINEIQDEQYKAAQMMRELEDNFGIVHNGYAMVRYTVFAPSRESIVVPGDPRGPVAMYNGYEWWHLPPPDQASRRASR